MRPYYIGPLLCSALLVLMSCRLALALPTSGAPGPIAVPTPGPVPTAGGPLPASAPVLGGALVTVPASKETRARRQALVANAGKAGLTSDEQQQAQRELVTYDQQLLTTWAHTLPCRDDKPMTAEFTPTRLTDAHLTGLFPEMLFYVVFFPGYLGGAPPSPATMRQYEAPSPLESTNILVVNKDGDIQLLTGLKSREQFFKAALPPITSAASAHSAVAGWLRLAQVFAWRYDQHPDFTIADAAITVTEPHGDVTNLEATGKAVADPNSMGRGDIIATLRFATDGTLLSDTETLHLRIDFYPRP